MVQVTPGMHLLESSPMFEMTFPGMKLPLRYSCPYEDPSFHGLYRRTDQLTELHFSGMLFGVLFYALVTFVHILVEKVTEHWDT